MNLIYKRATLDDIDILTETRILVLRAVYNVPQHIDMSEVETYSYEYYKEALGSDKHIAYLVFDGDEFVGAGGVSFFRVMPTYDNPTGEKAYIMNMYTKPEYRRNGIGLHTLDLLVKAAKERGITAIALDASDMGRLLYEKYGFVSASDEMKLPSTSNANG